MPGKWRIVTGVRVRRDPEPMSLGTNPEGAMRVVHHLLDLDHRVFGPGGADAAAASNRADARRLVYKRYKAATNAGLNRLGLANAIYFRDAWMQHATAA